MELISSVSELLLLISRLENQPISYHAKLVKGIGNYFYNFEPSEIDEVYVKKTEVYFNSLYKQMKSEGYDPDINEEVRMALGTLSAQCKKINIRDYSGEYFGTYKLLGEALIKIGNLMT
jgi:hypothetical protein